MTQDLCSLAPTTLINMHFAFDYILARFTDINGLQLNADDHILKNTPVGRLIKATVMKHKLALTAT